jgi:hypothetical protein
MTTTSGARKATDNGFDQWINQSTTLHRQSPSDSVLKIQTRSNNNPYSFVAVCFLGGSRYG